jgi:DNA-directed RNA polymerase sigma subunit (sigma70/sigma32)
VALQAAPESCRKKAKDVAPGFAVTRERIPQIEAKALRELRAFMNGVRD